MPKERFEEDILTKERKKEDQLGKGRRRGGGESKKV